MTPAKRTSRAGKRLTIGMIIARVADIGFAASFWPGVAAVAEECDANLVCFIGEVHGLGVGFDAARNVIYDLISPRSVDGLVAMSGALGQHIGPERLGRFYERFRPLPLVSVGMELEGIPSVLVDNLAGMRSAIAHLIEVHDFQRIAFIRGPETSPEAEDRYRAYREVLEEHGLVVDPDLVTAGNFLAASGGRGVAELLDRRKVRVQAIALANDAMAVNAIDALRRRGLSVPEQMPVVGFDDIEDVRYLIPPMTTVRQPFYEMGRKAAELLLDLLDGKTVPEKAVLPMELIVRRSCGCFPPMAESATAENRRRAGAKRPKPSAARRRKILARLESLAAGAASGVEAGWSENLFSALTKPVKPSASGEAFLLAWEQLLRQVGIKGDDVMQWHAVLAALRRESAPFLTRRGRSADERMWRSADLLVGEIAQWAHAHRRFEAGWHLNEFTARISEPLMTALNVERVTEIVASRLPELGIRSCYLSLYDFPAGGEPRAPAEWSRLILACNEKGRITLEPGGRRVPSLDLVPKDILALENRFNMVLEPLYFHGENQFGFIVLGPLQTEVSLLREALTRQIGTALKGAALLQEREQAEETLRASEQAERVFQERLRTLLEVGNELSRAGSVDELCREAVELGRSRLGFDRLAIWFYHPDPGVIKGSYGTGGDGGITDERDIHIQTKGLKMEILRQTRPIALLQAEANLRDKHGKILGRGMRAHAAMWNGEKVIGFVSLDNLLYRRPITDYDCELLNSFASNLGYLCSRIRAEEALKDYSGHLEEMVEDRTRALQKAQENLVRQGKLAVLGQLAATVSHELRNPLATIRVSAADLDRKVRDRGLGAERPLDRIQRSISRCDNIISELLDYARMPAPNFQPVDIDNWLNRVLNELTMPPGITLVRETASGAVLAIDPERLRRAVVNLVDNARQAMQGYASGAGKILTVRSESDADGLTICVTDTGPGMSPEVMEHLYEPLFSTKGFGVGLGLSVVKGIVEQHGGEIRICSRVGEGTQAAIRLPRMHREEGGS